MLVPAGDRLPSRLALADRSAAYRADLADPGMQVIEPDIDLRVTPVLVRLQLRLEIAFAHPPESGAPLEGLRIVESIFPVGHVGKR